VVGRLWADALDRQAELGHVGRRLVAAGIGRGVVDGPVGGGGSLGVRWISHSRRWKLACLKVDIGRRLMGGWVGRLSRAARGGSRATKEANEGWAKCDLGEMAVRSARVVRCTYG
jgi:hypothetical protein